MTSVTGIVLAAGAGARLGRPKSLMRTADGEPWVARAVHLLQAAGCRRVLVVLGACAEQATALVPPDSDILVVENWADGMAESLRQALAAILEDAAGDAAMITLVDVPDLPGQVVARILALPCDDSTLTQAVFSGQPGHPVLIGRAHWASIASSLEGDRGARDYLTQHGVSEIECGDLFDGHDVDRL
ncbi:MAG: nucleotidyltransferase family protein [Actinomycetota bacterium]